MPVWKFGTHFQNVWWPADFVYPHNGELITVEDIIPVYQQQLAHEAENPPPTERDELIEAILSSVRQDGYRGMQKPDRGRIRRKAYHPPDTPVRVLCEGNPWKPGSKYWEIWELVEPKTGDTLGQLKSRGMPRSMVYDTMYRWDHILEHAYDLKVSAEP